MAWKLWLVQSHAYEAASFALKLAVHNLCSAGCLQNHRNPLYVCLAPIVLFRRKSVTRLSHALLSEGSRPG